MKELKAAADSDSDSGRESEEEPGRTDQPERKAGGAKKQLQMNGGFCCWSSGRLRVELSLITRVLPCSVLASASFLECSRAEFFVVNALW